MLKKKHHLITKPTRLPKWVTFLGVLFLRLYYLTLRVKIVDPFGALDYLNSVDNKPIVAIIWHNRLLFFPLSMKRAHRLRAAAVISASRDGNMLEDVVKMFKVSPIRGSSSRNALQALRGCFDEKNRDKHLVFTPDGPRGPLYKMSNGPVIVASRLQRYILPLALNYSHFFSLKTWDHFQIPWPFSRLEIVYGEKMTIPQDISNTEFETYREQLKDALMKISVT